MKKKEVNKNRVIYYLLGLLLSLIFSYLWVDVVKEYFSLCDLVYGSSLYNEPLLIIVFIAGLFIHLLVFTGSLNYFNKKYRNKAIPPIIYAVFSLFIIFFILFLFTVSISFFRGQPPSFYCPH